MSEQSDLASFADQYGATDDPRESADLIPRDDGHLLRVNELDDYWFGLESYADGSYEPRSLVPAGRVVVVLDDSESAVERGWKHDAPLEPGVWLSGRDGLSSVKPPAPVAVDDEYLQFAAEAMLEAAAVVVDDPDRIVALSKPLLESLTIAVSDREAGEQVSVFDGGSMSGMPSSNDVDCRCGFFSIREMGTPFNVYSDVAVPRLGLQDLRTDALLEDRE